MITVVSGSIGPPPPIIVEFRADRAYDVYALDGVNTYGMAAILLGYAGASVKSIYNPFVTLKQGVAGHDGDSVYWSGHLMIIQGDVLFALFTGSDHPLDGNELRLKILLVPISVVKAVEKEAEKEWLP